MVDVNFTLTTGIFYELSEILYVKRCIDKRLRYCRAWQGEPLSQQVGAQHGLKANGIRPFPLSPAQIRRTFADFPKRAPNFYELI